MPDWLSTSTAQPRLNTRLLRTFAFLALLIASIGINGVLAIPRASARRKSASAWRWWHASRRAANALLEEMKVAAIGMGCGVIALALGETVSSLVFGVN